jgi:hypothetical protein
MFSKLREKDRKCGYFDEETKTFSMVAFHILLTFLWGSSYNVSISQRREILVYYSSHPPYSMKLKRRIISQISSIKSVADKQSNLTSNTDV